ncbi:hypothetical protein KJ641_02210 [Patescibacteria group bacterium]|nr:hypothetical protein [Patescibacteria group bacterium]MBU1895659.1 hypothetical protein [Patescibacteria group bacterium]
MAGLNNKGDERVLNEDGASFERDIAKRVADEIAEGACDEYRDLLMQSCLVPLGIFFASLRYIGGMGDELNTLAEKNKRHWPKDVSNARKMFKKLIPKRDNQKRD